MAYKFTGKHNTCVWDTKENKILCKFKNGVYETSDKKVADKLKALGYLPEVSDEGKQEGKDEGDK